MVIGFWVIGYCLVQLEISAIRSILFHIFRHTAITRWANSGVPLPVVQKWAGHSIVEMTMKYVHPSDEESTQWMEKFSRSGAEK